MPQARIIIISGAPGSGKSTITRLLAEHLSNKRTVLIRIDDFYSYICKGYIEPWLPESNDQNIAVAEAMVAVAKSFVTSGYDVFIDGVIGPWLISPWIKISSDGSDVHYVVLRPSLEVTTSRGVSRKGIDDLINPMVIKEMWNAFSDLGSYESHILDTTFQTAEESAELIKDILEKGFYRLLR